MRSLVFKRKKYYNEIVHERKREMTLDVLLSAMNLKDYHYIDSLYITGNCVIINQCEREFKDVFQENGRRIAYVETKERGLSKSRNMAIRMATSDICILCDNDVEYTAEYENIILKAYEEHPEYDVILFHVKSDIDQLPHYKTERSLNYITSLKGKSYEITFRRKKVEGIKFDERIGAGTIYGQGEENAFLYACLRKGLKLYYIPTEIASLRYEESTWKTGFDKTFFISRGASYEAMSHRLSTLLIIQYAVRKYKLYYRETGFWNAFRYMIQGKRLYKND